MSSRPSKWQPECAASTTAAGPNMVPAARQSSRPDGAVGEGEIASTMRSMPRQAAGRLGANAKARLKCEWAQSSAASA